MFVLEIGDTTVTPIVHGVIEYDTSLLSTASPTQLQAALGPGWATATTGMPYVAFLVRHRGRHILVDCGTGGKAPEVVAYRTLKQVGVRLRATGPHPDAIEDVLITHVDLDHVGGLTDHAGVVFPNATVRISQAELDFLDGLVAHPDTRSFFGNATDALAPYVESGRLAVIDDDHELGSGIRAIPMHGHTPGHTGYLLGEGADAVLFIGDLVYWAEVQFPFPDAGGWADRDATRAGNERQRILRLAADEGWWIAGGHLPSPSIGRVERKGDGFSWQPAG